MGKDSLSCSLASPIVVNQAFMICGVFWLHRRAMWHFATIKSKWVSSLNKGLCLAHLVLFDLGLKIVLFPEWTSHAEFFFLITHNPITDAEMNFFFPTTSPMICRDEETHVRRGGVDSMPFEYGQFHPRAPSELSDGCQPDPGCFQLVDQTWGVTVYIVVSSKTHYQLQRVDPGSSNIWLHFMLQMKSCEDERLSDFVIFISHPLCSAVSHNPHSLSPRPLPPVSSSRAQWVPLPVVGHTGLSPETYHRQQPKEDTKSACGSRLNESCCLARAGIPSVSAGHNRVWDPRLTWHSLSVRPPITWPRFLGHQLLQNSSFPEMGWQCRQN